MWLGMGTGGYWLLGFIALVVLVSIYGIIQAVREGKHGPDSRMSEAEYQRELKRILPQQPAHHQPTAKAREERACRLCKGTGMYWGVVRNTSFGPVMGHIPCCKR